MDTQNLIAFLAVADTGSFSLAAERLHLTQPAISKRISLLEQQLDASLFDRLGRHISLTEAGRTLLPRAREIMQAFRDAQQQIKDLRESVSGQLRLVTSHHIGLHRLPALLRHFAGSYPDVQIDIQFKDSEEACQSILAGEFDLGVVTRSSFADNRIDRECIWLDRLVFVAAADHPLGARKSVSLSEISRHPALLPDQKFLTTRIVEDLFRDHRLELNTIMSTNYLETIKALISVGYGWGVLPEIMLTDDSLIRLPVKGVKLVRHLDCIHHRERSLSNPARCFMALLRANSTGSNKSS
ncbi:MAG: LysR family transcriptional regulator [Gammaproteobacteria bacterium]|jgi:DNA-binding transcriptional LysR family regulator